MEELQNLRQILTKLNTSSTTSSSATGLLSNSSFNFAQISSYTSNNSSALTALDTSEYWILDSGATSHMTGQSKSFVSYLPCSGQDKVRIADGSFSTVSGKRTVNCTPTITLSSVLHVPSFPLIFSL